MSDLTFSPEFENRIRAAMAVPDPSPAFLDDLRQQLITQSKKTQAHPLGFFQRPALRWALAALAIILLTVLLIGPQQVASAFQKLLGLGYIPDMGIVDQASQVRVLAEPVTQTQDGVTVTVEQIILDSERTILRYQVDDIPMNSFPDTEMDPGCRHAPYLRLPDGTLLKAETLGWMSGWGSGYEENYVYPPLSVDIDNAILLIPCLTGTAANTVPTNWELPLHFVTAPPDMTVYPVLDLRPAATASPQPTFTPETTPAGIQPTTSEVSDSAFVPGDWEHAVQLRLDRVVQLDDGYAFYATFVWNDDPYYYALPDTVRLFDANGNEIPTEALPAEAEVSMGPPYQYPIAIKSLGPIAPGPITISVQDVEAGLWLDEPVNFSFDAGSDPQTGEEWTLDQQIEIAGHALTIQSVRAAMYLGQPSYAFVFLTDGEISFVRLTDEVNPVTAIYGDPAASYERSFVQQVQYVEKLPTGTVTYSIQRYELNLPGSWQATWEIPDDLQITTSLSEQATWMHPEPIENGPTPFPEAPESIYLSLDRVVQLDDGYIFYATFNWQDDAYTFFRPYSVRVLDANGEEIPSEELPAEAGASTDPHRHSLAIESLGPFTPGPITVSVDDVDVGLPVDASFIFDVGPDPQIGQEWRLDQNIDVAGHMLTIQSVRAVTDRGYPSYEFTIQTDAEAYYADLTDNANPIAGSGGGGVSTGPVIARINYLDSLPIGAVTISITQLHLRVAGPWQTTWTPPDEMQITIAPPEQASCLTSETWAQAKQQNPAVPPIWSGKLAVYSLPQEADEWLISVFDLDTNTEQLIGPGAPGALLSPDGSQLAYVGTDGPYIVDLAADEHRLLFATNYNIYGLHWSPDGKQIAFSSEVGISLIDVDGTHLEPLTEGIKFENLVGWLPDGKHILYTVGEAEGHLIRRLNLQSNSVEDLFTINTYFLDGISISPDGTQLAYLERLFGKKYGLFLSDLDGSNRQFFGELNTKLFSKPLWSPDGQWLLLSIWDDHEATHPFSALFQVDRCQIVPLPGLKTQFSSWVP
jgi:hypothetical protein